MYEGVHGPAEGLIISTAEYSPRFRILKARLNTSEPPLKHWSDVVYLNYEKICNDHNRSVRGLKHIFRQNIDNSTSHKIIELAMQNKFNKSYPAPAWGDRCVFHSGEDGANAILASPNGRGIAWMLLTHRAQLGMKRIKSIAVFEQDGVDSEKKYGPTLYFELENIPDR